MKIRVILDPSLRGKNSCEMPTIFSKNCVVTGDVDAYCLVCSTHLPAHEDVLAHIQESEHSASMKSITYCDKYKEDFIRKARSVYYCEACNKTFPTTTKVGIHVKEETHLDRKKRQFKRVGNSIVLQNNIVISENAWNSIVEDTCVLCDAELAEFDDYLTHKSEQTHILNVFRSAVIIDDNDKVYRKVNSGNQCLTCNKVLSDDLIAEHLNSSHHKDTLVQYDPNQSYINNVDNGLTKINADAVKNGKKNDEEYEAKRDGVNETSSNATDVKISTKKQSTVNNENTLYTRPVLMKGKEKPATSKTITEEVETFAKQHNLSVDKFNNTVCCNVCTLQVPATLNCVKEHVAGKKHKDKSTQSTKQQFTKKKDTKNITTVNMSEFVKTFVQIETWSGKKYLIINDTYCIMNADYLGIAKFGPKFMCRFCNIELWAENIRKHVVSYVHRNKLKNSLFVTSLENEFVRQVTSDLYQCGHCGKVVSQFQDMPSHLNTPEHKFRKAENERMLQQYKFQEAMQYKFQEAIQRINCVILSFMESESCLNLN